VVAQIHKRPPKFTQEWFKTFALHTTLYVFMWVVPVSGFFFQLFKSNNVRFGITLPDLFPQNSTMVELGRSYISLFILFGVHLPACFGSLEGCSG